MCVGGFFYLCFLNLSPMKNLTLLIALLATFGISYSQDKKPKDDFLKSETYNAFKFRSIGPAFMSGRISDVLIHPDNQNVWFVCVGSGGVWKTENAGSTWKPIFDGQPVYSIGCITMDPQNHNALWVGTGENVGGRHVAWGDGVYKSEDGGSTWKNMGLKTSEHISKIIVHPTNSNIIWVASQGPLWSKGGERGIFKTIDGGKTWKRTLGDEEWVGATDLLIDPRNPDLLYAATWQRHRTVAGYMGGGPGSGIHRSFDGGVTWEKLAGGLPTSNLGKIGMAISPQNPDVIYAAIELDRRKGGVYRSENRGVSWSKMSDAVSGGTGPHYYQELYACPHQFDRIYLADNVMQISDNGGKTFSRMNEGNKHIDNHAIGFKKGDPNYLLVGTDGGLYETFDRTTTWKFVGNLPVTQFYKIAIDDTKPFYRVYGGTQDNSTQGGPSKTDNANGIRNSDWEVILGGDGHQPATEPGNPNVVYAQWQQGNLTRHDRSTGENVYIQPQPDFGEKAERHNWDAPILVSPHKPQRIYFGSQRVWRSEDRGDSWTPISGDLTRQIERIQTKFYDEYQGWDNPWDIYAMSNFSTITSLAESPKKEGLIYAGTDDGIIQITENGGLTWQKIELSDLPKLPKMAFVNDIKADLFDENTVYAAFDNHKEGDYRPLLYKSTNKGKTWKNISNNLPEKTLVWRIVQDHVDPELLFIGTEFGVYFSKDGGENWMRLKGGLPNISVRDLAIHKRENDLVLGTFGRGIYILDDLSPLRKTPVLDTLTESVLYQPKVAQWYFPKKILGDSKKAFQGDAFYMAENPAFGAELTYYLKQSYETNSAKKKKQNKDSKAEPLDWAELESEKNEIQPKVWLEITDSRGDILTKVDAANSKGFNRVVWNLRKTSPELVRNGGADQQLPKGAMVAPGKYFGQLYKQVEGLPSPISNKVAIQVEPLYKSEIPGANPMAAAKFWDEFQDFSAKLEAMETHFRDCRIKLGLYMKAYERAEKRDGQLWNEFLAIQKQLDELGLQMNGSKVKPEVGEKNEYPNIRSYMWAISSATSSSTHGPNASSLKYFDIAQRMYKAFAPKVDGIRFKKLVDLEAKLIKLGVPLMEGERVKD